MDDNQLILDIGADISSFSKSMVELRKKYNQTAKEIKKMAGNTSLVQTTAQLVKSLSKQKEEYKKFAKEVRAINKDATNAEIRQVQATALKENEIRKKAIKNLLGFRKSVDERWSTEHILRVLKEEKQLVRQRNALYFKGVKQREAAEKAADERTARAKKLQLAQAEREYAAHYSKKQKGNWDFSGHRDIINSTLVVAKYGAISQALYGVQNALKDVIMEIGRFDQSMYNIRGVLNMTKDEAEALSLTINKLSQSYGTTASDIEEATLTIGRAGVDGVRQVADATKVLAQLSKVTGDSMSDGAAGLATMLSVYPELRKDITGLGEAMGYVANATKLGLKDFTTISNYALTTAKSIGMSADAYLSLAGAMSKVGLNASTIGTSIRRLKKFMDSSSESMRIFYRMLGTSQKELAASLEDDKSTEKIDESAEGLKKFTRALATMKRDEADRYREMTKDLNTFEKATIDSLTQIGENDYFSSMFKTASEGIDATGKKLKTLEEQAALMSRGISDTFKRLKNTISQSFDEAAVNTIGKIFDDTTSEEEYQKQIQNIADTFWTVIKTISLAGTYITTFLVSMKALRLAQKIYNRELIITRSIMNGIGKLSKKNVAALVIAGVATAVAYFTSKADEAKEKVEDLMNASEDAIRSMENVQRLHGEDLLVEKLQQTKEELADIKDEAKANGEYTRTWYLTVVKMSEEEQRAHDAKIAAKEAEIKKIKEKLGLLKAISKEEEPKKFKADSYGKKSDFEPNAKEQGLLAKTALIEQQINGILSKRQAQYISILSKIHDYRISLEAANKVANNESRQIEINAKLQEELLRKKQLDVAMSKDLDKATKSLAENENKLAIATGKITKEKADVLQSEYKVKQAQDKVAESTKNGWMPVRKHISQKVI